VVEIRIENEIVLAAIANRKKLLNFLNLFPFFPEVGATDCFSAELALSERLGLFALVATH
jgi:predicted AAA+ superfamily ATPase